MRWMLWSFTAGLGEGEKRYFVAEGSEPRALEEAGRGRVQRAEGGRAAVEWGRFTGHRRERL